MLLVNELSKIAVNDFDAKKSAGYSKVFVVTELAVSGTQYLVLHLFNIVTVYLSWFVWPHRRCPTVVRPADL